MTTNPTTSTGKVSLIDRKADLFNQDDGADLVFIFAGNKQIFAHREVVLAYSKMLAAYVNKHAKQEKGQRDKILVIGHPYEIWYQFMRLVYLGKFDYTDRQVKLFHMLAKDFRDKAIMKAIVKDLRAQITKVEPCPRHIYVRSERSEMCMHFDSDFWENMTKGDTESRQRQLDEIELYEDES